MPGPNYITHKRLYGVWSSMRDRCNNSRNKHYKNYGGRGIKVCERWDSFALFVSDMGERPDGCSLDRKDNDGPYAPWNCRWATRLEQNRNRRDTIMCDGESVRAICQAKGLNFDVVKSRIKRGWTAHRAVNHPIAPIAPSLDAETVAAILNRRASGEVIRKIASDVGVSEATISNVIFGKGAYGMGAV